MQDGGEGEEEGTGKGGEEEEEGGGEDEEEEEEQEEEEEEQQEEDEAVREAHHACREGGWAGGRDSLGSGDTRPARGPQRGSEKSARTFKILCLCNCSFP